MKDKNKGRTVLGDQSGQPKPMHDHLWASNMKQKSSRSGLHVELCFCIHMKYYADKNCLDTL